MSKFYKPLLVCVTFLIITSCGQKGPLYLPALKQNSTNGPAAPTPF